jgi:hypothetical protein
MMRSKYLHNIRRHLKIRIFGRDQGEAEDQPAGILKYVEDLIRGLNADIGRKDFLEMASKINFGFVPTDACFVKEKSCRADFIIIETKGFYAPVWRRAVQAGIL